MLVVMLLPIMVYTPLKQFKDVLMFYVTRSSGLEARNTK